MSPWRQSRTSHVGIAGRRRGVELKAPNPASGRREAKQARPSQRKQRQMPCGLPDRRASSQRGLLEAGRDRDPKDECNHLRPGWAEAAALRRPCRHAERPAMGGGSELQIGMRCSAERVCLRFGLSPELMFQSYFPFSRQRRNALLRTPNSDGSRSTTRRHPSTGPARPSCVLRRRLSCPHWPALRRSVGPAKINAAVPKLRRPVRAVCWMALINANQTLILNGC